MIKLKVKGKANEFYDALIDDDFKVSSKDKISKKVVENLIKSSNLDTTGSEGALEYQVLDYLKKDKFYNEIVKIIDIKTVYYPYNYEIIG